MKSQVCVLLVWLLCFLQLKSVFPLFTIFQMVSIISSFWISRSSFVNTFHPKTNYFSWTTVVEESNTSQIQRIRLYFENDLQLLFWHFASCSSDCWVTKRSFSRNDWSSSLNKLVKMSNSGRLHPWNPDYFENLLHSDKFLF